MLKGYHCVKNGIEKGVRGWTSRRGGASPHKTLLSTPPPQPPEENGERKKETGAKPNLSSSPITVALLAVLCFVFI